MTEEQKKTRTKLAEQRHSERRPHISYDLDGDGYVGGKDYVIAKQFDKDGDGILNAEERKQAFEALKNVRYLILIAYRVMSPSLFGTLRSRVPTGLSESYKSVESCAMQRTFSL